MSVLSRRFDAWQGGELARWSVTMIGPALIPKLVQLLIVRSCCPEFTQIEFCGLTKRRAETDLSSTAASQVPANIYGKNPGCHLWMATTMGYQVHDELLPAGSSPQRAFKLPYHSVSVTNTRKDPWMYLTCPDRDRCPLPGRHLVQQLVITVVLQRTKPSVELPEPFSYARIDFHRQ